ncbi:MAG: hypothetical protein ACI8QC_003180 [Planctomycetota bacterium]|jgi:hypothetical protein
MAWQARRAGWAGMLLFVAGGAGCSAENPEPVDALTPEASVDTAPEAEGAEVELQTPVGLRKRIIEVADAQAELPAEDELGVDAATSEESVSFYDEDSGSPFSLLEHGELSELLPTEANFIRVLGESDDLTEEQAAALWARGDVRRSYEVCMHFAAAAYFARGYMDRETDRSIAGEESVSLASEMAAAGPYLRAHVLDRQGFERGMDEAQRRARIELWNAPEGKEFNAGDWCTELYGVFEETTTHYYDVGIDPYLR